MIGRVLCEEWNIVLIVSIIILNGSILFSEPNLLDTYQKSSAYEHAGF